MTQKKDIKRHCGRGRKRHEVHQETRGLRGDAIVLLAGYTDLEGELEHKLVSQRCEVSCGGYPIRDPHGWPPPMTSCLLIMHYI